MSARLAIHISLATAVPSLWHVLLSDAPDFVGVRVLACGYREFNHLKREVIVYNWCRVRCW